MPIEERALVVLSGAEIERIVLSSSVAVIDSWVVVGTLRIK